jgi:cyanate permease
VLEEVRLSSMSGPETAPTSLPVLAFAVFGALAPVRPQGRPPAAAVSLMAVVAGLWPGGGRPRHDVLVLSALALAGMAIMNVLILLVKLHSPTGSGSPPRSTRRLWRSASPRRSS